jgi:hypothetical protein
MEVTMEAIWLLVIFQGIIFGAFSSFVAKQKNRGAITWFLLGFLFSFIALLALIAVPKIDKKAETVPMTTREAFIAIALVVLTVVAIIVAILK